MKRFTALTAALGAFSLAFLLAGASAQTAPDTRPARPDAPPARSAPPSSLDGTPTMQTFQDGMERAGRALRGLKRSNFDASSRSADLAAIQSLQTGLLASKSAASVLPMSSNAKKKFGDDQSAYQTALRSALVQALRQSLTVEDGILSSSGDSAKAALAKLVEMQESDHELFQSEE